MVIEYDASLSRADTGTSNNHGFSYTIWNTVLSYYSRVTGSSISVAAKVKCNRAKMKAAHNITFAYRFIQLIFDYEKTAAYLSTMEIQ
ncbi:hypothetical protein BGZ60DRAFT_536827 [Tricladium varicosporioides]|nr:hypothetical protein BGZ60DRAFT_536827 [Hymenoscyphus varicosporioides]